MELRNDRIYLTTGETYNFFKNIKDYWIVKILDRDEDRYTVEILKRVGPDQKYREGEKGFIGIRSNMFSTYQITKYHKANIDESIDPEVEDLIAHVQKQFEINKLQELIDLALQNRQVEAFMEFSKQLNKLKGVLV
jgi:hypothetical protein